MNATTFASLLMLLPHEAPASTTLTLDDVWRSVQQHHPAIAIATAERNIAAGDRLAAEGAFDPVLRARAGAEAGSYDNQQLDVGVDVPTALWGTSFSAGWRLGRGDIASYEKDDNTDARGEVRGGVSVPLWRNGPIDRRRATIERQVLEELASESWQQVTLLDLKRQAALRYWEWVARGARLRIAEDLERIAEQRASQLSERVKAGDLPEVEAVDNLRLVASRQQRVVQARRGLEQAAIELALFVRDDTGAPRVVPRSALPELTMPAARPLAADQLVDTAVRTRPELLRAQHQLAQAQVEVRWSDNQIAPAIDLFGEVRQGLGSDGVRVGTSDVLGGVRFDLPAFLRPGRGRAAAASAARVRAEEQARLWRDRVQLEVEDGQSAVRTADERAGFAEQEAALSASVEASERQRFDGGDSTILQVNLREQATADARTVLVDAWLDAWRARVQLDAATGALLDRSQR